MLTTSRARDLGGLLESRGERFVHLGKRGLHQVSLLQPQTSLLTNVS